MIDPRHNINTKFISHTLIVGSLTLTSCFGSSSRTPVCMPGAQIAPDGQCHAVDSPLHRMPFRAGFKTKVTQGFHGYLSHKDDQAFSLDFKCKRGQPIVASRTGVVWDRRKTSDRGCDNRSCADQANFVVLDHGDGTYTEYYHLQHWGAMVDKGQTVCAGQLIGLCGTTGFSTGPHLHFAVTDLSRQTVPVRFAEAMNPGTGFMVPESTYISTNIMDVQCPPQSFSNLPPHAFAHHGIVIDTPLPTYVRTNTQPKIHITGNYYGTYPNIAVNFKAVNEGKWKSICTPVQNGRFAVTLDWKKHSANKHGFHWFILTGTNKKCDGGGPGWAWSYKIQVHPK